MMKAMAEEARDSRLSGKTFFEYHLHAGTPELLARNSTTVELFPLWRACHVRKRRLLRAAGIQPWLRSNPYTDRNFALPAAK
jgi:hypothetical protein